MHTWLGGSRNLRRGILRPTSRGVEDPERLLLHSPQMVWAPFASSVYHDLVWYPTVGRRHIRTFNKTEWGRLWQTYETGPRLPKHVYGNVEKWQRHMARA
jgi:hypothetical protein